MLAQVMSNPEGHPAEVTCVTGAARPGAVEVLPAREVPLGGPRAMPVRRSLPQRGRSLIGAWCFVDHYGPDEVDRTGGMRVPGHPHTGLQTVSWLFSGEVEHRDTTGAHAQVRPGELNIMTAGSGIAHSEFSTPGTTVLHGVQLWVALPEASRFAAPGFEHHAPEQVDVDGSKVRVFLGELFGSRSPVTTHTALVGAEIVLPAGATLAVDVDPAHEHGVLCDTGVISVHGASVRPGEIAYAAPGTSRLTVAASPGEESRMLLIGGEPLREQIVMWWNFVGRSHDEIVAFREDWERERAAQAGADGRPRHAGGRHTPESEETRFGTFPTEWDHTLPAPPLPHLRLRSRG